MSIKLIKTPSKEAYEALINKIYNVIDEYIEYRNKEGWEEFDKGNLFGMWQLADSVKNQINITNDIENIGINIDLEKKVQSYIDLYEKLENK